MLPSNPFMRQALVQAQLAFDANEVPVGAVIVNQNTIIAAAGNRVIECSDPTAHAEMLAIRSACVFLKSERLIDCDLYVTLEPCPMCATAISFARLRRVYFGAADPKGGGVENGPRIFSQPTCHHKPEIIGAMAEGECGELLKKFFQSLRK